MMYFLLNLSSYGSLRTSKQASLVGIVQVTSTFVAVLIVDKLGRKILLITSAATQSLSIICLGVYFWEKEHSCTDLGVTKDCVTDDTLSTIGFLPLVSQMSVWQVE